MQGCKQNIMAKIAYAIALHFLDKTTFTIRSLCIFCVPNIMWSIMKNELAKQEIIIIPTYPEI